MRAIVATTYIFLFQAATTTAFYTGRLDSPAVGTRTPTNLNSYARQQEGYGANYLLDDFRTAEGEVVNPYRVLEVKRAAEIGEIKQQYRKMSKMYHPDVVRHKDVLPGKCNDLNDVRDEWERILLSYEILSDHRQRLKYDRHSTLHNIGHVVGWGMTNLASGLSFTARTVGEGIEEGKKMSTKAEYVVGEVSVHMKRIEVVAKQAITLIDYTSKEIEKIVVSAINHVRTAQITSTASSSSKALKAVSVPPPSGKYYSPFEACSIILEHERHPTMDKPKAMRIMLENNYVPIKRTQLYNIFNKFKDGSVTEDKQWRQQGGKLKAATRRSR